MARFFKREEKQPFSYPTIKEYKEDRNYILWIAGVIVVGIILAIAVFIL